MSSAPPEPDVIAAWLHPGEVTASFASSYNKARAFDWELSRRILGEIENHCAAGRIIDGRNDVVRSFLEHPTAQWLWWIDADMGFERHALEQLLIVANDGERPIVGGLCFGQKLLRVSEDGAREFDMFPTIYQKVGEKFAPFYEYPKDTLIECDGTGSAFLLVHRSVFEKIREVEGGDFWYTQIQTSDRGAPLGEDLSFCARAKACGFKVHVHTAIRTSHAKTIYLNEAFYDRDRSVPKKTKRFVVIPVKGKQEMTANLLKQLSEQGGYDEILVFDNGSPKKMRNWLETQKYASVFDAPNAGIHEMWNAGVEYALRADPCADVIFLNNDLEIGPEFCDRLCEGLRYNHKVVAACANYDGRDMENPVEQVWGICAGRYDGTGGFAGFAFAVRGEFFTQAGYRFPEEAKWWFGDNDLCLSVYEQDGWTAIVRDATCVHLDGGSQTANYEDPEFAAQLVRDQEWFESKWDMKTGLRRQREFVLDAPA